jgi:hypothetical protein
MLNKFGCGPFSKVACFMLNKSQFRHRADLPKEIKTLIVVFGASEGLAINVEQFYEKN